MPAIHTAADILQTFATIRMAPVGGGRAVHKPLLILFWLGRLQRNEPRTAAFADVEAAFKQWTKPLRGSSHAGACNLR